MIRLTKLYFVLVITLFISCKDSFEPLVSSFQYTNLKSVSPGCVVFINDNVGELSNMKVESVLWDFGDGTTSTDKGTTVDHCYSKNGTYKVSLTLTNSNESKTSTQEVVIAEFSSAKSSFSFEKSNPVTVTFKNTSSDATSYEWSFGDGTNSKEVSPIKVYTKNGFFTVSLKAISINGESSVSREIEIDGIVPTPQFEWKEDNNGMVTFENKSINAKSYQWNFGDGTTSTVENPSHSFTKNGKYNVELIAAYNENKKGIIKPVDPRNIVGLLGCKVLKMNHANNTPFEFDYTGSVGPIGLKNFSLSYKISYSSPLKISKLEQVIGDNVFESFEFTYADSRVSKITNIFGSNKTEWGIEYNKEGLVSKVSKNNASKEYARFEYDEKGNVVKLFYYNTVDGAESLKAEFSKYDTKTGVFARDNIYKDLFTVLCFNSFEESVYLISPNNPIEGQDSRGRSLKYSNYVYNTQNQPVSFKRSVDFFDLDYTINYDCN